MQMVASLKACNLTKTFTLHNQGGVKLDVFRNVDFEALAGICVCLHGASGTGKSSLMKSLYANYKPDSGTVIVQHAGREVDLVRAEPWEVMAIRRNTIGYVSQFLRTLPRVSALAVVAEPAIAAGMAYEKARARAMELLERLRIPERLWSLPPATFSGGEQQRINIARGFVVDYPILLLDEPTASLDATNRKTVAELIEAAKNRGAAIVGIFHDADFRSVVADRLYEIGRPDVH